MSILQVNEIRTLDGEVIYKQGQTATTTATTANDSVSFLSQLLTVSPNDIAVVNVLNYHTGLEGGGGVFYWDATKAKSEHNGGTIVDPTAVFPTDWNNQTQLGTWFNTANAGTGVWVRQYDAKVSVKFFGAIGDGVVVDVLAVQKTIDHAFDKREICFVPAGTYITTKPLIIRGRANELPGGGSFQFIGAGREAVTFKKITSTPADLPAPYNKDAVIIIAHQTFATAKSSQARQLYVDGFACDSLERDAVEYGIYTPISLIESRFSNISIRFCNKAFWTDGGNIYLSTFDKLRLQRCDYGFYLNGGINTSLTISNCYVLGSNIVAFKLPTQYSTVIAPAVDGCLGICYDLHNFRGDINSPGAESRNAECIFSFQGGSPFYTVCNITSPWVFGLSSPEAEAIRMAVGKVTITGGHLNVGFDSFNTYPGKLIEFVGTSAAQRQIAFLGNVQCNAFGLLPTNSMANTFISWEMYRATRAAPKIGELLTLTSSERNAQFSGVSKLASNGQLRNNKFEYLKNISSTSSTPVVASTITIQPREVAMFVEVNLIASRAGGSAITDTGTSIVGKHYFSIARSGSGHDVVIDNNLGAKDWTATTTTAGGDSNATAPALNVVRAGSELNTDPQAVNITVVARTAGGNQNTVLVDVKVLMMGTASSVEFS